VRKIKMMLLLLAALVSGLLISPPVAGQQARDYEPFVPTPEYAEARQMIIGTKDRETGLQKMLEIAARHPGTTLAANALFSAAQFSRTPEQERSILQSLISAYPNSTFEILARLSLLNLDIPFRDFRGYITATESLARTFGGPSLDQIIRGDLRAAVTRTKALPNGYQQGLIPVYYELHGALAQLSRYDEAARLAVYGRDAFGAISPNAGEQFAGKIEYDLVCRKFGAWNGYHPKRADPTVTIRSPKDGATKGPRPKIRVVTEVGDYQHAQVAVSQVKLLLDGVDISHLMVVASDINTSMKSGKVFEKLRLSWRPTQKLARGTHTLSLTVPTMGYAGSGPGIARLTWSFKVVREHDDKDDDEDDGDSCFRDDD